MAMDPKVIKSISNQVYRQFPEMAGIRPKIRLQQIRAGAPPVVPTYLLTFNTKVSLEDGHVLPRLVRVVANQQGSIIKITTSH